MDHSSVQIIHIEKDQAGQRVDNFLFSRLKGVPKSRVYRILRKGEVRVNKSRVKPEYRLQEGDQLRVPPIRTAEKKASNRPGQALATLLKRSVIYEDDELMVLNKPAGMAVHAGSGINLGLIEALRSIYPEYRFLELVHRLDRGTSGCLLIAKKRSALRFLQDQLRAGTMEKSYLALVMGRWDKGQTKIEAPLLKVAVGEEMLVRPHVEGKSSITHFGVIQVFSQSTLLQAKLETGRTHQIRVHAQLAGHPLAGDEKYGDRDFNQAMKVLGLKRLFLHACELSFKTCSGRWLTVSAPLPDDLELVLARLR